LKRLLNSRDLLRELEHWLRGRTLSLNGTTRRSGFTFALLTIDELLFSL